MMTSTWQKMARAHDAYVKDSNTRPSVDVAGRGAVFVYESTLTRIAKLVRCEQVQLTAACASSWAMRVQPSVDQMRNAGSHHPHLTSKGIMVEIHDPVFTLLSRIISTIATSDPPSIHCS